MNISGGGSGSGPRGGSQDFDLNLAPIIDCFTVLITFMLVSASFLAIGIFSAGIEAAGSVAADAKTPAIRVQVTLQENFGIELKVTGKEKADHNFSSKQGGLDLNSLEGYLHELKRKWPELESLTIIAQNNVEYMNIIKTMESSHKILPSVYLGGF